MIVLSYFCHGAFEHITEKYSPKKRNFYKISQKECSRYFQNFSADDKKNKEMTKRYQYSECVLYRIV